MGLEDLLSIWRRILSDPTLGIALALVVVGLSAATWYLSAYFGEKGRTAAAGQRDSTRPYIDIEADEIEFQAWSQEEIRSDPSMTEQCQKILLWFYVHSPGDVPAANVDISAKAELLVHKNIGNPSPRRWNAPYTHNLHMITKANSGRQAFTLALGKRAVPSFEDGTIEVKLIIRITYTGLNGGKKYWTEKAYIYSPVLPDKAAEVYSKGG